MFDRLGQRPQAAVSAAAELANFLADFPDSCGCAIRQRKAAQAGDASFSARARACALPAPAARTARCCPGRERAWRRACGVRAALHDASFEVRIAAARTVGIARDRRSPRLDGRIAQNDERTTPPGRTALGQIGDPQAVPALLRAAATPARLVSRTLHHLFAEYPSALRSRHRRSPG